MKKMINVLSYTQDEFEALIARHMHSSEQKIKFMTENGCGEFHENFSTHTIDWENIKEQIFSEYDALWKELARR